MPSYSTGLSGHEVRASLERAGFVFCGQTGSHIVLRCDSPYARVTVPIHKVIRSGTLQRIIAEFTVGDFRAALSHDSVTD